MSLRVLVVDDDALIRDSLKILLEMEGYEVVGLAANGQEALEVCAHSCPDLVLMDIRMPVLDGVLGTKRIKEKYPSVNVLILTTFRDDAYIREAIKNGAAGYVLKNQPSDSIMDSIRAVGKGNVVFEKGIGENLQEILHKQERKKPQDFALTSREFEVLSLVGEGLSNREIAERLFLSEGTVRNYTTTLLEKLELRDRTQLAIFFVKHFG